MLIYGHTEFTDWWKHVNVNRVTFLQVRIPNVLWLGWCPDETWGVNFQCHIRDNLLHFFSSLFFLFFHIMFWLVLVGALSAVSNLRLCYCHSHSSPKSLSFIMHALLPCAYRWENPSFFRGLIWSMISLFLWKFGLPLVRGFSPHNWNKLNLMPPLNLGLALETNQVIIWVKCFYSRLFLIADKVSIYA